MATPSLKDVDWIRQQFILPTKRMAIDNVDYVRRMHNPGFRKFNDTTLGGNAALNPPPQFTRNADIVEDRLFPNPDQCMGLGECYSSAIDDNAVYLHIRAGVARFNSLTSFFGNYYSTDASRLARTGQTSGILYRVGRVAGWVISLRFLPLIITGQMLRFLFMKPSTKYYYLTPTMPLFWNALNMSLNTWAANTGWVQTASPEDYGTTPMELTPDDIAERNRILPDVWRENGMINIYRIATRYQRLANRQWSDMRDLTERANSIEELKESQLAKLNASPWFNSRERTIEAYTEEYLNLRTTSVANDVNKEISQSVTSEDQATDVKVAFVSEFVEDVKAYYGSGDPTSETDPGAPDDGLRKFLNAELEDGAQFITFKVDGTPTISESFSNSIKESEIASTINGMSSGARGTRFSFANGNLNDSVIGKVIGGAISMVGQVMSGIVDGTVISGLGQLAGNALVDIPKYWDGSTANLPRMNYTFKLRAPYGNDISRFQNLIVPLYSLLCLALPLSTGAQSYTSPFLIEAYCKGRAQTPLAIIDALEIVRGTGNVGWTQSGKPLGIDVTISIVDLSSVMHMPLTSSFTPWDALNPGKMVTKMLTGDDTAFGTYSAILSSLGLQDQIYPWRKLKRNWYRGVADFNTYFSQAHLANWVGGWMPARALSAFWNATERP